MASRNNQVPNRKAKLAKQKAKRRTFEEDGMGGGAYSPGTGDSLVFKYNIDDPKLADDLSRLIGGTYFISNSRLLIVAPFLLKKMEIDDPADLESTGGHRTLAGGLLAQLDAKSDGSRFREIALRYIFANAAASVDGAWDRLIAETLEHTIRTVACEKGLIEKRSLRLSEKDAKAIAGMRHNKTPQLDYDLGQLRQYYGKLYPVWRSAKVDAVSAQRNPLLKANWRARVARSYDIPLPNDLVEWFCVDDPLPQLLAFTGFKFLQDLLKRGERLSKPSDIALEHSARLCGAVPYYYALPTLFALLKKQTREYDDAVRRNAKLRSTPSPRKR